MNKIQIPWEDRPVGCTDGYVALLTKSSYRTLSYSFI